MMNSMMRSDGIDLFASKLSAGILLSTKHGWSYNSSSLGIHIQPIVRFCAKEEVRNIAAAGIVTVVTYQQALWDGTVFQLPRHAMRQHALTVGSSAPITFLYAPGAPRPAGIYSPTSINMRPEAGNKRGTILRLHFTPPRVSATSGAVTSSARTICLPHHYTNKRSHFQALIPRRMTFDRLPLTSQNGVAPTRGRTG